jgi:hypothetical protein
VTVDGGASRENSSAIAMQEAAFLVMMEHSLIDT